MSNADQAECIREIVDRLVGQNSLNALNLGPAQLDVSRPNIHDNKKDFQKELDLVRDTVEHLETAFNNLIGRTDEERLGWPYKRLTRAIDESARRRRFARDVPKSMVELIRENTAETGFYSNFLFLILDFSHEMEKRLTELKDQEKQFWSVDHRPPNYYARTVALRLARLYANEKGKRPTFGTARDGGHPSTDFGRALEEIFSILKIRASVNNAAKWAIGQLTDDDLVPLGSGPINRLEASLAA